MTIIPCLDGSWSWALLFFSTKYNEQKKVKGQVEQTFEKNKSLSEIGQGIKDHAQE
jgi:hypothetical protein